MNKEKRKVFKYTIDNFEEIICVTLLAFMFVIILMQVFQRYVINHPNGWSEELARYVHVWTIFIASSLAAKHNAHIRIEGLLNVWPKKIRKHILEIGEVMWIVYNMLVIYFGWKLTMNVFELGQTSFTLFNLKYGWIYMAIPIGYTIMTIRIIQNRVIFYRKRVSGPSEPTLKGDV